MKVQLEIEKKISTNYT